MTYNYSQPIIDCTAYLVAALRYIRDNGREVDIVNMSIQQNGTTPELDSLLSELAKTKILIAAGGKYLFYTCF